MKKILAILLIAILAAGSMFAAISGTVGTDVFFDLDSKAFGINNTKASVAIDIGVGSETLEAKSEGDIYTSVKAALDVDLSIAEDAIDSKGGFGSSTLLVYDSVLGVATAESKTTKNNPSFNFELTEAKVGGADWYVSLLGLDAAPSYAKSFLDLNFDGKDDDLKTTFNKVGGLEVSYKDFILGAGTTWAAGKGTDIALYLATPKFNIAEGLTFGAAVSYSDKTNNSTNATPALGAYVGRNATNTGWDVKFDVAAADATVAGKDITASASIAYEADKLSLSAGTDIALPLDAMSTTEAEVSVGMAYDFITANMYFQSNAADLAKSQLHANAGVNLASFDIPVAIDVTLANILTDIKVSASASTDVSGVTAKVSTEVSSSAWKVGAEIGYSIEDICDLAAAVSYNNKNMLGLSLSAENTTLIPGAKLALGWNGAEDILNKNTELNTCKEKVYLEVGENVLVAAARAVLIEDHSNYGKITASCTIEF